MPDNSISKIIEVYAPLEVGVQYEYNQEITDSTIDSMKTLLDNFVDILGGSNGKISPVVAKYITSGISVLSSGTFTNIHCSVLMNDGVQDIAFKNEWSNDNLSIFNELKNYSEDLIETESYYKYISVYLPKNSVTSNNTGISYSTILALLLAQGDNLQDSNFVNVLRLYNLNNNYLLMIKHTLVSAVRIYSILANFIKSPAKISISLLELDTLINNIKYVSCALELYDLSIRPILLIKEVRKLHIAIQNVRGTIELFDNYSREVES